MSSNLENLLLGTCRTFSEIHINIVEVHVDILRKSKIILFSMN